MNRCTINISATFAALLLFSTPLQAQVSNANEPAVSIGGGATDGSLGINAAAGNFNQQANVGVIATSDIALGSIVVAQNLGEVDGSGGSHAGVEIAAGAFASSNGWIAANAVEGNGNQQANLSVMALGFDAMAVGSSVLSQSRATASSESLMEGPSADPSGITIGEGAFQGASGLVQLSLVGGDRNTSANVFSLTVSVPQD